MRKTAPLLGALAVLLLAASLTFFVKYRRATADYQQMKTAEAASQERYARTIDAIAEIQDSLNTISLGDTSVQMISRDLAAERKLGPQDSREAMDRIALLRSVVQRSKDRIRSLESSLKANGIKVAGLQKMIRNLKSSVTEKEQLVAQLNDQVGQLQTQVGDLTTQVQQNQVAIVERDSTLEVRRKELATVYVAMGTRKELAQKGVITAKGGVLGLGKTLQPSGQPDPTAFTPIDTDHETVVRTSASKPKQARVLSAQPSSSYELVVVDGKVELHILDPVEFRKIRQLVILTA